MSNVTYQLEHFYFGQVVKNGQPLEIPRLLAVSSGISATDAELYMQTNRVPAPLNASYSTWAIMRGNRKMPFTYIQGLKGKSGEAVFHVIVFPSDIIRAVGGNLRGLQKLLVSNIPTFSRIPQKLFSVEFTQPELQDEGQEIDDILELMTFMKNKIENMKLALGTLIQGKHLVITQAPDNFETRLLFISGILSLLPPSVRFAVTFATHADPELPLDVQISFIDDEPEHDLGSDTIIYNWRAAKISGETIDDSYSHFMVSQLRLDTQFVIDRTRQMKEPAGWRMRQGDRLAEALAYGSYRLRIDEALLNNQPVNKDDVAKIIETDPTLTQELQKVYAKHLLKFSLAMNDLEHATPVLHLLPKNPELEDVAYQEMLEAIKDKQARSVYRTISGWLVNRSIKHKKQWVTLAHRAAILGVTEFVNTHNLTQLNEFLVDLQHSSDAVEIQSIAPQITELILPKTPRDPKLAENLFLLAVAHLDIGILQRLLNMNPFLSQLRPEVRKLWSYLNDDSQTGNQKDLLKATARSFGGEWESLILLRFGEMARYEDKLELLDQTVLKGVLRLALTSRAEMFGDRILYVVGQMSNKELEQIGRESAYEIARVKLALGNYADLATTLLQQSSVLYPGDLQIDYLKMIQKLFAETPIPPENLSRSLTEIYVNGIKSSPLIMAHLGALQGRSEHQELYKLASKIEEIISTDPRMLHVIPPASLLILLAFYADNADSPSAVRVAQLIPTAAELQGANTLKLSSEMFRIMDQKEATRDAGLDILRVFVRESEGRESRQAVAYYGRELGMDVRSALQASYFVNKLFPDNDIFSFARSIQIATLFLSDTAAPYSGRNTPTTAELYEGFNHIAGSYSREERRDVPKNLLVMAKGILQLAKHHKRFRRRDQAGLVAGVVDPKNVLDMLKVIAGYFSNGKPVKLALDSQSNTPLSERNRKVLATEIDTTRVLLSTLYRVFPPDKPAPITAKDIRGEIDSIFKHLDDQTQETIKRILAIDLQKFIALVEMIGDNGDIKAIEEGALSKKLDSGKQRPRNTIEFYRFLHGYIVSHG